MWGSIIAGGLNLAGGLLGSGLFGGGSSPEGGGAKKAKHHALDYDRRRIKAIVDGAKDAGIHPLAAIGASGGGGSFAAPVNSGSSGWGAGDVVGRALQGFSELYQSDQDRMEERERYQSEVRERQRERALENLRSKEITPEIRLQRENMQLQNELLRADIATSRSKLFGARHAAVGATAGTPSVISPDTGNLVVAPALMPDLVRSPTVDAQKASDLYGDVIGELYGIGNYAHDFYKSRLEPLGKSAWEWYIEPFKRKQPQ